MRACVHAGACVLETTSFCMFDRDSRSTRVCYRDSLGVYDGDSQSTHVCDTDSLS